MMKRYTEEPRELLAKRWPNTSARNKKLIDYVKPIVADVAKRGDVAIREYTEKFDGVLLEIFKVTPEDVQEAYRNVNKRQVEALQESKKRLEVVESQRLTSSNFTVEINGTKITCTLKPLNTVGCYVPGGKAAYPSSVVMNVTPAKVAGIKKIIVCTPPGKDGKVSPLTLVAADICMVDEVYKIGGIQAIAAMAYGTESVPKMDKIVGPGNKYVTAAKTVVSESVAIDKPAGPSEILVMTDDTANPMLVAVDLISQAEHGTGGISGLVTTSKRVADAVDNLIKKLVPSLERSEIIGGVLAENGFVYTVGSIKEAIDFANKFAPEHIEVMTRRPEEVVEGITSSGLVLLGNYTPVSSTDYCMGVNHVLPTEGYAKVSSGITIFDYMKPVSIVKATKTGLGSIRAKVAIMAQSEGLPNHKKAVEARFKLISTSS
ncbi:MAG: histidinol dehydrogenase [Candidatus Bathyarchaeota archaeon]|nr:histidinol dehydrogenase [Candidatus Bathyarchaeota archaeon]